MLLQSGSFIAQLNCLLALAAVASLATLALANRNLLLSFANAQAIMRVALVTALFAPGVSISAKHLIGEKPLLQPALQIREELVGNRNYDARQAPAIVVSPSRTNATGLPVENFESIVWVLLALTVVSLFGRAAILVRDLQRLREIIARSTPVRTIGRVSIRVATAVKTPLAMRLGGRAIVVVPESLLFNPRALDVSIRHELQHHRNGDLLWDRLFEIARAFAGWNPLVRLWIDRLEECDELACDEVLLGRRNIGTRVYANSLLEVAKAATSTGATFKLAGTARMAVSPSFLRRRIEMAFTDRTSGSRLAVAAMAGALVLISTLTAWAGSDLVKDRRVSEARAIQLAKKTQSRTGIPIVINKQVLFWLNQITSNERTRFWARNTMKRMKTYEPMIRGKLSAASLPYELTTVPALETGYQNTETVTATGIWSFIPATARRYGLQVDDTIDERLDAEKLTDAAVAYFTHLQKIFGTDWYLSLLSYNAGERLVQNVVAQAGHKDVFRLAEEGWLKKEENKNYVPKFLATLIVINNPELVAE